MRRVDLVPRQPVNDIADVPVRYLVVFVYICQKRNVPYYVFFVGIRIMELSLASAGQVILSTGLYYRSRGTDWCVWLVFSRLPLNFLILDDSCMTDNHHLSRGAQYYPPSYQIICSRNKVSFMEDKMQPWQRHFMKFPQFHRCMIFVHKAPRP